MPITLPPISRRRFLQGTAALLGSLALPRPFSLGADAPQADPNRIILYSDPHIDANRAFKHDSGVCMWDNLIAANQEVLALTPPPSAVFVNGDCAHDWGLSEDYGTFINGVKPLREAGLPIHVTLGNHDNRENILKAIPTETALADRFVSIAPLKLADVYMLDSLQETHVTPGTLGEAQLAWLAKSLDAKPDRPAIVMVHHNPKTVGNEKIGITDTAAFLDLCKPRKQVKAIIFGHTHVWQKATDDGIHLFNLPPIGYVFDQKQPSGWVDAQLSEKGMTLQLHSLTPNHPKDKEKIELTWRS